MQDEIVSRRQLRPPLQVQPICRELLAKGTLLGAPGIELQIGVIDLLKCDQTGCHPR
jgi:hypothetical protein